MKELGLSHHTKGTMVSIEGPRFSTRAEGNMFRAWGADVINTAAFPGAPLAGAGGNGGEGAGIASLVIDHLLGWHPALHHPNAHG